MSSNVIPFAKPVPKFYCDICRDNGITRLLVRRPTVFGGRVWHCRGCGWLGEG